MSENQQAQTGDQTADQSVEQDKPEQQIETKTQDELVKRLKETAAEAKQYRQRLADEKKKREDAERKALADAGNWQEIANRATQDAEAAKERAEKLKQAFAVKTISDRVALEATRLGCIDSDLLVNVLPLDQVQTDESFNVDTNSVRALIEDVRKTKPYLFKKESPKVADVTPGKTAVTTGKPVEKMSSKEIEQLLKEKFKK